jgi:hypothetical protein
MHRQGAHVYIPHKVALGLKRQAAANGQSFAAFIRQVLGAVDRDQMGAAVIDAPQTIPDDVELPNIPRGSRS